MRACRVVSAVLLLTVAAVQANGDKNKSAKKGAEASKEEKANAKLPPCGACANLVASFDQVLFLVFMFPQLSLDRLCNTLPCDCEVGGHFMCKEMPVIPVNKKRIIRQRRAEEEQMHQGVADPKKCNIPVRLFQRKKTFYVLRPKQKLFYSNWVVSNKP
jgi:hypothetical protein